VSRGVRPATAPAARPRCAHCNYRWAQVRGLCHHCERAQFEVGLSLFVREQTRRAQRQARIAALIPPPRAPFVERTITIRGETFVVMWDGS